MNLRDIIVGIDQLPDGVVVFAVEPWGPDAPAAAVPEPEAGDPTGPPDMTYLLEVDVIRDVLRVWSDWRSGDRPDPNQAAEAVVHYAVHDAYLPA